MKLNLGFISGLYLLAVLIISMPVQAREGIPTVNSRAQNSCQQAIRTRINNARVGEPPRRIPTRFRGRASNSIFIAIRNRSSESEAYEAFYNQLRVVNNRYYREDLAEAAANIVGDPPSAC
jgi:hypothetical protein